MPPTMSGDAARLNKRRRNRVPVSCFSCRTLKTKCDGARPVCSTCSHNRRDCMYAQHGISGSAGGMVTISQDHLRRLERRLEMLEKSGPPRGPSQHTINATQSQMVIADFNQLPTAPEQPVVAAEDLTSGPTSSSMVVDANVSIGGLSFAQLILDALYGYGKVKAQPMMTDSECRHRVVSLTADDLYALPESATEILDEYFARLHELTPMFHQPSARRAFNDVLKCPTEHRHRFSTLLALLNMISALVTSLREGDVEVNAGKARRYYDIAMALLQPSLLRDCRMDHVQALILGARYLQTSNCGEECWNVLGLAVRVAYGLCLHQDPSSSDPPTVRETKRRVWYAAYTLDMHWSMIYQRPAATRSSDHSVSLPEDLDDECIREDGILRPMPRRASLMSFSIEMIKLYRVVEIALSRISDNAGGIRETAELVMDLDDEWKKWHRDVPDFLTLHYDNPQEKHWILALRGNMVRILIHRQSFSAVLDRSRTAQQSQESLAGEMLQRSQKICVDAAMESVDIVALRYEQMKNKGLNWFNIYYLFNAVIILISHIINATNFPDGNVIAKAEKAMDMIKAASSDHSSSKRAFVFLNKLLQCLNEPLGGQQQREDEVVPTSSVSVSQTTAPFPATSFTGQDAFPGLHALFGHTQDLAQDLQAQLGNLDAEVFGESSWNLISQLYRN